MMILRKSFAELSISSLFLMWFFIWLFIAPTTLHAEEISDTMKLASAACPIPGTVPISEADRAAAHAAGIPDSVSCWNPNDTATNRQVGQAKVYLRSILCASDRDNYGGAGADGTISSLNPGFAVCAANFLRAARANMDVCVHEGYRTKEMQQTYFDRYRKGTGPLACDPRTNKCEHPQGMAIDVNAASESSYPVLWKLAPQYGLWFEHGAKDPVHFAPRVEGCYTRRSGAPTAPLDQTLPISLYEYVDPATVLNASGNPFQNVLQALQQSQLLSSMTNFLKQNPSAQNSVIPPASPIYPTNNPSGAANTVGSPANNPATIPRTHPIDIPTATATPPVETPALQKKKVLSPLDVILQAAGLEDQPLTAPTSAAPSVNGNIKDVSQATPPVSATPAPSNVSNATLPTPTAITRDLKDASFPPIAQTMSAGERTRFFSILDQLSAGLTHLSLIIAAPRPASWIGIWYPASQRAYQ